MRYLGIDYGSKRIGLAYSDESGTIAMPLSVIKSDKESIKNILKVIEEKKIEHVVIGESKDGKGNDNAIMAEIKTFSIKLQEEFKNTRQTIDIAFEPEFFTSMHAAEGGGEKLDASAAALILQRHLDKQKHKEKLNK